MLLGLKEYFEDLAVRVLFVRYIKNLFLSLGLGALG